MFNKILIANRGEIACRIIRTAKRMGIKTVAVYSEADKNSFHLSQAHEAFYIGEAPAKESYLNIENIIEAARCAGVDAIHPGYGFLSENPQFAEACEKAGIVFIGPPVKALKLMASKQLAKQWLEPAGIPMTPGYHGENQNDQHLLNEAQKIGFPILLKAANGGGGKGMRAVYAEAEFFEALEGARREAMSSFADSTMIIEKYIQKARHIEVQIMADNHGQAVHLFERDCSLQRRHQKIIEEAPAPHFSQALREAMTKAACDTARSINYRGAGTVEFLYDGDKQFYFMEMNTRLQVEHPVTEMITGLDLVEWQLKIAAGEPMPCQQNDIVQQGHAIECRIYAEDPLNNFMPSTGEIQWLREPAGPGVRVDSGVKTGSIISRFYDPMVAKLITRGETRNEALQRMRQALEDYTIAGIKTNLPFLKSICQRPEFIQGRIFTHFLSENKIEMAEIDYISGFILAAAWDYLQLTKNQDPLHLASFAWQMHLNTSWTKIYRIEDRVEELKIFPKTHSAFTLELEGECFHLEVKSDAEQICVDNGRQLNRAWVHEKNDTLMFASEKQIYSVKRENAYRNLSSAHADQERPLTAPMPATVVAVLKQRGDEVKKGEALMVLEAMKMEHTIHATKDGFLAELFYDIGEQVNEGSELLVLQDIKSEDRHGVPATSHTG